MSRANSLRGSTNQELLELRSMLWFRQLWSCSKRATFACFAIKQRAAWRLMFFCPLDHVFMSPVETLMIAKISTSCRSISSASAPATTAVIGQMIIPILYIAIKLQLQIQIHVSWCDWIHEQHFSICFLLTLKIRDWRCFRGGNDICPGTSPVCLQSDRCERTRFFHFLLGKNPSVLGRSSNDGKTMVPFGTSKVRPHQLQWTSSTAISSPMDLAPQPAPAPPVVALGVIHIFASWRGGTSHPKGK